jgi:phosphoadenosine phosphosulfate reductase
MTVTMIKKRLADGSICKKCVEAEALLKRRGAWGFIDAVVWAVEDDPKSEGMRLAKRHGVEAAPFFLVDAVGQEPTLYTSALKLHRSVLKVRTMTTPDTEMSRLVSIEGEAKALKDAEPQQIVRWALETYGGDTAIAFSGAEDVAVIDLAFKTGLPFKVFTLDTGRLHPETLRFIENVRVHYGIPIQVMSPDAEALEAFVAERGLFSFFTEGHEPCCGLRKVAPLRRALSGRPAWITGQRRDQNPATRGDLPVVQTDPVFGSEDTPLVKINPLANWSSTRLWSYLHTEGVPTNRLHEQGFRSIGCAPCTRPVTADQTERDGRWWWEDSLKRECGLHVDLKADT